MRWIKPDIEGFYSGGFFARELGEGNYRRHGSAGDS